VLDGRDAVRYMYTCELAGSHRALIICAGIDRFNKRKVSVRKRRHVPDAYFTSIPTCLERDKTFRLRVVLDDTGEISWLCVSGSDMIWKREVPWHHNKVQMRHTC
jgi:hypothetical protein